MNKQIDKATKSGARIDVTYGQVYAVGSGYASIYIAGSRELAALEGEVAIPSEYFRVPPLFDVAASDYVRVSIDDRGHRWIDEILGPTRINASALKVNNIDVRTRLPSRLGPFELVDVPAAKTDGPMALMGGVTSSYSARPIAGATGRIIGIAWRINVAPTTGTISLTPVISGLAAGGAVVLNSSTGTTGSTVNGTDSFTAGSSLGINISSSADLTPATLDVGAWLLFEQDAWSV